MRNVVIFLEESSEIHRVGANLLPHLMDGDYLYVLMELPELKSDAMPLIGDLKEIRYRKAKAQLQNWYQNISFKIEDFKPIIFQEGITPKKLSAHLLEIDKLLVFGMPHQEKGVRKLFEPLNKKIKLDFVFANGQVK